MKPDLNGERGQVDEGLMALYLDWWLNHPVPDDPDDDGPKVALDDFMSLLATLRQHGYEVVHFGRTVTDDAR